MKILITGGCGFIGSNLAANALMVGYDLIVFDNLYRNASCDNLKWLRQKGNFKFVHGDIRNANDVDRVVDDIKPDIVFHLAGQVAMTTSISNPVFDFQTNAVGTLNLIEAIRRKSQNSLVFYSSTNKVYGDLEQYNYLETPTRYACLEKPNGFDEDTPLNFQSPYGCSKGAADQYLIDYNRIYGIKSIVFRHSSVYGGRQFATSDQGWVGWFCQKSLETIYAKSHAPFSISGTGKQVRDVLHVNDVVDLYFNCSQVGDKLAGNIFNIGGGVGNSMSIIELLDRLGAHLGVPVKYYHEPRRISDQRFFVADISKISRSIGWTPKVSSIDGLKQMLEWVDSSVMNL
jgi:CDP-paratose 2-epimerase